VQVLALLTYNLIFDGLTEVSRGHWVIHFFTDMQQKNLRNGEVR
jgi:pentatricopeptide repeat protein